MKLVEIKWRSPQYEQAVAMRHDLLRAPLGLTFSESDLQAEQDHWHFALENTAGEMNACVVVVPLATRHAKIRQMCVRATQQNQGLGTQLLTAVESNLIERDIESVELNARDHAVSFYHRLGYQKASQPFTEVGIPHLKMTKSLIESAS